MVYVELDRVTVEFPLLHVGNRSLKKAIVARATGGSVLAEAGAPKVVRALSELTLSIRSGDRLGLVGPNGSGKTTLLRTLAGIYEPVAGTLHSEGRIATLLDVAAGMSPELTGWENIQLRGMLLGFNRAQVEEISPSIEEFTELGDFLNMPLRTYSSGMMLRLAFALATSIEPDILLMDEWVLAGDAAFAAKASARLSAMVERAKVMVLASHSESVIREWCNRAIYVKHGSLIADGSVDEVLTRYYSDIGT